MKTTEPTIHLAMAAIIKDIEAIAKDKKNDAQGFKFRGIDDVYNNLHPIFAAHGVTCRPRVVNISPNQFLSDKGKAVFRTHVTVDYHFSAADGSELIATTVGEGMDNGDKSTAKAMSVAHKYLLLQTFLIPTSDIVDGDYYDPTIDPHEMLKQKRDEEAKAIVMAGGDNIPLPDHGEEKLAAKRAALEQSIKDREAKERDENAVLDEKKPVEKKAAKAKAAPTPPPPQEEEEGDGGEGDGTEGASWADYAISQITIAKFVGKKLSELSFDDIKGLKEGWSDKYAEKIKTNPAKVIESSMIVAAYNALKP